MYTDEQICALLGVFEASDEEIERARARIERKRRKEQGHNCSGAEIAPFIMPFHS